MALTINTNLSSITAQSNLNKATKSLNQSIERMTTGYKINHASDNAAGYSISKNWETQISSLDIAADNAATGADMLTTLEDTYSLISSHLQRVRDLTEQAANGTYGDASKDAIESEMTARLEEVNRIVANCEFNGLKMMDGSLGDIDLQVGLYSDADSRITLKDTLFAKADIKTLFGEELADVAKKCSGKDTAATASSMLTKIDEVINGISGRVTTLGSAQNRIESAVESIGVQSENLTSSLSTLRDADVAEESSNYIKSQILQQAAATLLATANQSPSIALNLI